MIKVAIIGRANVGKSTLFNRLCGKKQAMVSGQPGTTRDLKYTTVDWQGKIFELIDSGGFLAEQKIASNDPVKKERKKLKKLAIGDVDRQVELMARKALETSEVILFVVDGQEGINPQDREISAYLRKQKKKKIIVAVNKCDNPKIRSLASEFYKLGLGEPLMISAASGSGVGDLLDKITAKHLEKERQNDQNNQTQIIVSIIGKPNVGKSSLLNAISGENKAIVSSEAHTTREPNEMLVNFNNHKIKFIDTAGIRRKNKVTKFSLEKLGIKMSIEALKKSDLALLVLDMTEPISQQDMQLGKLVAQAGLAAIIVGNKYDITGEENESQTITEYTDYVYTKFPHLKWAPIVMVSAKSGKNIQKILNLVLETEKETKIKIPNGALNKFLKRLIKNQPPPKITIGHGSKTKTKRAFISEFKQKETNPPVFECYIGNEEKLPRNYIKYIINNLRAKFGFKGTPIRLAVRYKKAREQKY